MKTEIFAEDRVLFVRWGVTIVVIVQCTKGSMVHRTGRLLAGNISIEHQYFLLGEEMDPVCHL